MHFMSIEKKTGCEEKVVYLPFPFSARFVMAKELKLEDDLSIFSSSTAEKSMKDQNITLDYFTNEKNVLIRFQLV